VTTKKAYSAKDGALFIQPLGPNTATHFLGCFDLGDVDEPFGDPDLIQCWSTDGCSADTLGEVEKPPEKVKSSLATVLAKTANYVEKICTGNQGKISLYALTRSGGTPKLFSNRVRASVLHNVRMTSHKQTNLVKRIDNAAGGLEWEVVAWPLTWTAFGIKATRDSTIAETRALNAVATLRSCDECNCDTAWAVSDAGGGAAHVWYKDYTVTNWTQCAADPFGAAENIAFIALLPMTVNTYRVIVGRGTTDAGNPAEIAYSDDKGATWTTVNVGAVNGMYFIGKKSVCAVDYNNIWVCATDGYIYFSADGGLTWAAQLEAGAGQLNATHFADDLIGVCVGNANAVCITYDGGDGWNVTTGPASKAGVNINACWALDIDRIWLLYADGDLWYTFDGGDTWFERNIEGVTATEMVDISFPPNNDHFAFLILRKGSYLLDRAEIYRTINGGYTWEYVDPPSNEGFNSIVACNENRALVVGEAYIGRTMITDVYNV
jgi:photosystem II stability/assembly factor-like uncharacterized protein